MTKVSIILPVYNVETYLRECLDSALAQTLQEIEIICVNDGSTDSSPAILEEYAKKDARVKVIQKENSGYGQTMNMGIDAAQGEYIGILETDDFVPKEMYATLYEKAKKFDLDFIKADFYRFEENPDGTLNRVYNQLSEDPSFYNKVLCPGDHLETFRFIMNTWSGIYKKAFLDAYHIRHNETPGASYQDNGFWFQTFCRAKRALFLDQPLYMNRRDNPNSSVKSKGKVFCVRDEYDYIRDFLRKNPELEQKFLGIYYVKRFHNYLFTVDRVAEEWKRPFLQHFSETFRNAQAELDESAFLPYEWEKLQWIMRDPEEYYFLNCHGNISELHKAKEELAKIKRSKSYRIGRGITWLPRKIRGFFQCVKEHGLKYTFRLAGRKAKGN